MKIDESQLASAEITPANTTNKNIKWSSSNTKVATIDSNGNISAKGNGTVV